MYSGRSTSGDCDLCEPKCEDRSESKFVSIFPEGYMNIDGIAIFVYSAVTDLVSFVVD